MCSHFFYIQMSDLYQVKEDNESLAKSVEGIQKITSFM